MGLAAAMGERLRRDLAADGLDDAAIERDAGRAYARISGAPLLILLCLTPADMDDYPDARRRGHDRARLRLRRRPSIRRSLRS